MKKILMGVKKNLYKTKFLVNSMHNIIKLKKFKKINLVMVNKK